MTEKPVTVEEMLAVLNKLVLTVADARLSGQVVIDWGDKDRKALAQLKACIAKSALADKLADSAEEALARLRPSGNTIWSAESDEFLNLHAILKAYRGAGR